MRKFFIIFLALCLCLPLATAWALTEAGGGGSENGVDLTKIFPTSGDDLQTIINRVGSLLFIISIPIAVIMILWSGLEFITAGGDPKKITTARNRIKYTLIGMAVIILATSAVALIQYLLTGT